MENTQIYHVDTRWLPRHMRGTVWTRFEDMSLLEEGTIVFDPAGPYHGRVTGFSEANGTRFVLIKWSKASDNTLHDCIPFGRFANMYLFWADPVMQDE